MTDLKAVVANKRIEVHLHWSEYLHGEWSTRESGGLRSTGLSRSANAISKPVKCIHPRLQGTL